MMTLNYIHYSQTAVGSIHHVMSALLRQHIAPVCRLPPAPHETGRRETGKRWLGGGSMVLLRDANIFYNSLWTVSFGAYIDKVFTSFECEINSWIAQVTGVSFIACERYLLVLPLRRWCFDIRLWLSYQKKWITTPGRGRSSSSRHVR